MDSQCGANLSGYVVLTTIGLQMADHRQSKFLGLPERSQYCFSEICYGWRVHSEEKWQEPAFRLSWKCAAEFFRDALNFLVIPLGFDSFEQDQPSFLHRPAQTPVLGSRARGVGGGGSRTAASLSSSYWASVSLCTSLLTGTVHPGEITYIHSAGAVQRSW